MTWFWRKDDPLRSWFWRNFKAVLSNSRKRIAFLFLDALLIVFLFYLLSYSLEYNRDLGLANQLFTLGFYFLLVCVPFLYGFRNSIQIITELELNASIHSVRREIERIRKQKGKFRALQIKINNTRRGLKDFIDYSEIVSPPIYNYELDRLQKRIDLFFNVISEVLFPIPQVFSRKEKLEQQMYEAYRSQEHPTKEEMAEQYEEMQERQEGIIDWFDLSALDEFLFYLGDCLFAHSEVFSPFSFKHPINLIMLSRFFERWNTIVSSCRNCKRAYKKSREDIEEYYKLLGRRESEHRQRIRRLIDGAMVLILSVILSTIVNYLMK